MPSFYSPKGGLTVAPARASFEDLAPFSVKEILERHQINEHMNDGYAEDKEALDLMLQKTAREIFTSTIRHVKSQVAVFAACPG